ENRAITVSDLPLCVERSRCVSVSCLPVIYDGARVGHLIRVRNRRMVNLNRSASCRLHVKLDRTASQVQRTPRPVKRRGQVRSGVVLPHVVGCRHLYSDVWVCEPVLMPYVRVSVAVVLNSKAVPCEFVRLSDDAVVKRISFGPSTGGELADGPSWSIT